MPTPLDLEQFLATSELANLGPGARKGVQSEAALEKQLAPLLGASRLSPERQELVRSLILLWHDHLDAAHTIAQNLEGADGAFVHGIMHRREPDYGNATYWFRRVGRHSVFGQIANRAIPVLDSAGEHELAGRLVRQGSWDPFAFIDACEHASSKSDAHQRVLREIQKEEFRALLHSFLT